MARIAGVELQDNWRLPYALTKIKGIGWSLSKRIIKELKLDSSKRVSDLSAGEVSKIAGQMEKHPIEGDLVRQVRGNIQRLKTISAYRGVRHSKNLPARGQRTRSNARTKRGKRKTVGAFKKEALSKIQQPVAKKEE
jgi:small subunit ribosomal protein S13